MKRSKLNETFCVARPSSYLTSPPGINRSLSVSRTSYYRSGAGTQIGKVLKPAESMPSIEIKPVEEQKKPRRTWNLQDRSDLHVHLLKENMAQEGCEESQLKIAKQLLEGNNQDTHISSSEQRENEKKAVYWLVKSAEQGNQEATSLLEGCLKSGKGITWQNISEVRACILTPKNEKLVFKAVQRLYDKLNHGEEFITTTQIFCHMTKEKSEPKLNTTFEVIANGNGKAHQPVDEAKDEQEEEEPLSGDFTLVGGKEGQEQEQEEAVDESQDFSLEAGTKLTKSDLYYIAKSYNQGNIPAVGINPSIKDTRFMKLDLTWLILIAAVVQFLALGVLLRAITITSGLRIAAALVTFAASYCFFVWRYRILLIDEWTTAFKSVLQNHKVEDFSSKSQVCKSQLLPVYSASIFSLCILHVLEASPTLIAISGGITLYGIVLGVLSLTNLWKLILAASVSAFPIYGLPLFNAQVMVSEIILIPDLVVDNMQVAAITTSFVIISGGLLRRKTIWEYETLGVFVGYAWILKFMYCATDISESNLYLILGSLICLTTWMHQVTWKSVRAWKVVIRFLAVLLSVSMIVITLMMLSEKNSLVNINDGNKDIQRASWEDYNQNCNRVAWKRKTVPETILYCSEKYETMPTFVTWDGRISGVKIVHHERSSYSLNAVFEVLISIESPSEPEEHMSGWQNLLPGGTKEKDTPSLVSLMISTDEIVGAPGKQDAIDRLLKFRSGDRIEFHGILRKGAGSIKPEIGEVQLIRCLKCAMNDYAGYSYTTKSLTVSVLAPLKNYLGVELFERLSELEAQYRSLLSQIMNTVQESMSFETRY